MTQVSRLHGYSLILKLRIIGQTMESIEDSPKMIDLYFGRIEKVMNMDGSPFRLRFMLLDTIEMRKSDREWESD
jgi:translation initiation factor 4G